MIRIRLRNRRLISEIRDFYINIWLDRLTNLTLRNYSYRRALQNYLNVLTFFGKTFDDNAIKETQKNDWKRRGYKEIHDMNWHFAVIVQLDLFGQHIAIVQDCCHDKDYHNDTMETQPFVMDNPDDLSHLADWKKYTKQLIREHNKDYFNEQLNDIIGRTVRSVLREHLSKTVRK